MALRSMVQSSGVRDWVVQRLSAVVLGIYLVFIVVILLIRPELDFSAWKALFDSPIMKIFSLAALISVCTHSWIGMWTVTTDYLTPIQLGSFASPVRLIAQGLILILISGYLLWGGYILWG